MDRWDVNAIIMAHVNRVFAAASSVVGSSADVNEGTVISLLGNLLWAASPYVAHDRSEEATMAFTGAIVGTMGPTFAGAREDGAANEAAEVEFLEHHDQLVELVWSSLVEAGLHQKGSYAAVNAHAWKVLFPELRYQQSLRALARQIAALMVR